MKKNPNRLTPVWALILIDALLLAAFLSVFCYFHHVRTIWGIGIAPNETEAPMMVITKPQRPTSPATDPTIASGTNPVTDSRGESAQTSDPLLTIESVQSPVSTEDSPITAPIPPVTTAKPPVTESPATLDTSGDFGASFPEMFAQGKNEVNRGENFYQSHDVYIKVTEVDTIMEQLPKKSASKPEKTHVRYYLADVYVRNIENLFTSYSVGKNKPFANLLSGTGALFALSGDVFNSGTESKEIIIRNGNVIRYQDYISSDICVLYWDGSMETITPKAFNWDKIVAKAPYQAWSFGPELLNDDGSAKTGIESAVWRLNPRAAIGYVEPGHYVLLAVHGNRGDGSTEGGDGMNLDVMAKILSDAGCKQAYNLDGGASVYGYFDGNMLVSFSGNRSISDIICIGETG